MDSINFTPDHLEMLFEYHKHFRMFTLALQRKNEALYNSIVYKDPTMAHRTFGIDDDTLLHTVGRFGTPDTAELLIKLGSDVNARDNNGHTPLYHAAKRSTKIVKILVNNGADISIPSNESITPLQQVLLLGSVERLEILLKKPPTQTHKPSTDVQGCREVLELLFNQRERTDLQLTKEDFPLIIFFAARYGDEESFKLILQESEQFLTKEDMEDIKNNKEYLDIYEIHPLPARDPIELNIQGYFGRTALHYAVREQLPDVVRFLLNQGADVNATTHYFYTPLHYAACLQNEEIIQILLNAGADLNLKSRIGATPLHLVSDYSSFKTLIRPGHGVNYHEYPIELLCHHYRESDVAFNPRVITLLLKSGANIKVRGEHGTTVFHEACREGCLDMVIFFLKCGADPYARDEENRISLHHAALGNNLDIVELLLRIGLEVDAINNFGCTPFIYLAQDKRQERLEMIEFFVDKGYCASCCYQLRTS